MESGRPRIAEEIVPRGEERRVYLSAKAPWLRHGEVVGLIGVSRDITDRKTAEEALAALNAELEARVETRSRQIEAAESQIRQMQKIEAISQLTGGIAHDFNNMLAIVIGSLDIAALRLDTDLEKARQCISQAQDAANRAARLTSRLLAFARQQPLSPAPIDVNRLVGGLSELLRRTLGEAIELETVLAGGLWSTLIDAEELEVAILNLCVNARDAMERGGRLTVETANAHLDDAYAAANADVVPGQYVLISVTDTGVGMAPEVVERAFDPFYATKSVGRGTGLGLSQVFGFIKQSGGHVKIYPEVGHGTTVKLYLARHFGPAPAVSSAPALPAAPIDGGAETILLVEDEDGVRNLGVEALRDLGYTVIHAASGLAALARLDDGLKVDLLFSDIVMPGMNGRELAEAARARHPDLKVLYTTGYTRNAIVHNGVLDPDVALLSKPFTLAQLALKVRQVLDA